jgi:hypothetical protein
VALISVKANAPAKSCRVLACIARLPSNIRRENNPAFHGMFRRRGERRNSFGHLAHWRHAHGKGLRPLALSTQLV